MTMPVEIQEPVVEEVTVTDKPWIVIVWNDPVNLMSYVVYVFQKLFGYSRKKATKLMRQVHEEGKAVVSDGTVEKCEADVARLHAARPLGHDGTPYRELARWRNAVPSRVPTSTLIVSLAEEELDLLARLPDELREVFEGDADDPVRAPPLPAVAYLDPTAEAEEAEWQALVAPSLLRQRLDALELITVDARARGLVGRLVADRAHARRGAGVARCAQRHPAGARHPARRHRRGARARPLRPRRGPVRRCTSG